MHGLAAGIYKQLIIIGITGFTGIPLLQKNFQDTKKYALKKIGKNPLF